MLLEGSMLERHRQEIEELYREFLGEVPSGLTYFGHLEKDTLQAAASLKCYCGHWYFRGCVVKPEYRGKGLQRLLIRERIDFLLPRTEVVRVGVLPENTHSMINLEREGFVFEKKKIIPSGALVHIYKKLITQ